MSAPSDEVALADRRFQIQYCLGRGGFGEVYRAVMVSSGGVHSEVAIKVLRADIDPGSEAVARLRDEGRVLGAVRHPSILRVHDLVLLEGRVALVTEYVEGEDLDRCIEGNPPLPPRALVMALGDVASGLDAAWSTPSPHTGQPIKLVHRDIKPANIRLGRHGEVKLLDFGVARAVDMQREAHTADHAMMGSYLYMAPERFTDDVVESASDMYALGCVLYEGLARRRYFDGMSLKAIYGMMLSNRKLQSHLEARIEALPPQHEGVEQLLRDLLASDPDERPTAALTARRCEDLADDLTGSSLKRWARRREWPTGPPPVTGSLDGRDLVAEVYVPAPSPEPEPELGPPLDLDRSPRPTPRSLPPNVRFTPPPVRPRRHEHPDVVEPEPWLASDPTLPQPLVEEDDVPVAVVVDEPDEPLPVALRQTEPPLPARVTPPLLDLVTEESDPPEPIPYIEVSDVHVPPEPIPEVGLDSVEASIVRMRQERRRSLLQWGVAVGVLLLAAAAAIAWTLVGPELVEELEANVAAGDVTTATTADPRPVAAPIRPRPVPPPPVPRIEDAEIVEAEAPEAVEPPPVVPEPVPTPPKRRLNLRPLHDRGWAAVDQGDFSKALKIFEDAVGRAPADPGGLYGRGYTLMKLGRNEAATKDLCAAIRHGEGSLQREVRSIMAGQGLDCQ